jgi:hypothetical protein
VAAGVVRREHALVDQRLHVRVVLGDLGQLAVAYQIAAAVTHVERGHPLAGQQQRRDRRAHAVAGVVVGDGGLDALVGRRQGRDQVLQRLAGVGHVVDHAQRPDQDVAGQLAGGQPAHAVRDHEEAVADENRVFVVGPHEALIGGGDRPNDKRHVTRLPKA